MLTEIENDSPTPRAANGEQASVPGLDLYHLHDNNNNNNENGNGEGAADASMLALAKLTKRSGVNAHANEERAKSRYLEDYEEYYHPSPKNVAQETAKNIFVFKNGDSFFSGKRVCVNRRQLRTWGALLEELTRTLQTGGAIREIRTPNHGTRIKRLEQLENNANYVALRYGEQLKKTEYDSGKAVSQSSQTSSEKNSRIHRNVYINPRYKNIKSKLMNFEEYKRQGVSIKVFRNGDNKTPAISVLLKHLDRSRMDLAIRAVQERITLDGFKPINFIFTMDGELVSEPGQLEDSKTYVASFSDKFRRTNYGSGELPAIKAGKFFKRERTRYTWQLPTPPWSGYGKKQDHANHNNNNDDDDDDGDGDADRHTRQNQRAGAVIYGGKSSLAIRPEKKLPARSSEQNNRHGETANARSQNTASSTVSSSASASTIPINSENPPTSTRNSEKPHTIVEEKSEEDDAQERMQHAWDKNRENTRNLDQSGRKEEEERAMSESERPDEKHQRAEEERVDDDDKEKIVQNEEDGETEENEDNVEPNQSNNIASNDDHEKGETEEQLKEQEHDEEEEQKRAAIKIQANYRGHLHRSKASRKPESNSEAGKREEKEKEEAEVEGEDKTTTTQTEPPNEQEVTEQNAEELTEETKEEEDEKLEKNEEEQEANEEDAEQETDQKDEDEEEMQRRQVAATKIQTEYKKFVRRKNEKAQNSEAAAATRDETKNEESPEINKDQAENEVNHEPDDEPDDEPEDDSYKDATEEERERASKIIQAGYRAHKNRQLTTNNDE